MVVAVRFCPPFVHTLVHMFEMISHCSGPQWGGVFDFDAVSEGFALLSELSSLSPKQLGDVGCIDYEVL
jgi:hypothetical protein